MGVQGPSGDSAQETATGQSYDSGDYEKLMNAALERFCGDHLRSQLLADTFSADRLIESWRSTARLMTEGFTRLDRAVEHLERRKRRPRRVGKDASPTVRVARLALVVAVLAALIASGTTHRQLGLNIFSVELVLFASAGFLLLLNVARWLGGGK